MPQGDEHDHDSNLPAEDTLTDAGGSKRPSTLASADRLQLIVSIEGVFTTHHLPNSGAVTIGRSAGNTVRIEHPSISRAHAILAIGDPIRVVDLGSSNGTSIAGHPIVANVPHDIAPGDAVELGAAMMMIQRVAAASPPRRLLSHDYFEARVEEECARRARSGGTFVIVRVHVPSEAPSADVEQTFQASLRAHDVLALYAPNEYEILVDATPEQSAEVIGRTRRQFAAAGIGVRIGSACYPLDGATPGALLAVANATVRGGSIADEWRDITLSSSPMDGLRELVERVAQSSISVLILGETGVGKEVMAEKLHRLSPRRDKTFLRLNCAALSESLLESELFGHERGAFTGAVSTKRGLLESADGGTVFLDEVGELPLSTQVKLLRVLEERKVTRVGALVAKPIDVRFVAATNRDLEAEIARGSFREDLFFRLNGVSVVVPPLRERRGELEALARAFITQASRDLPRAPELSAEALERLLDYSWPGNIRELRNVIERAVLLAGTTPILPRHLPLEKMRATIAARAPRMPPPSVAPPLPTHPPSFRAENSTDAWPALRSSSQMPSVGKLKVEIEAIERQRILDALEACAWNQTKAAQLLGIARGTLVSRLDQYGIARPRKPNP